MRDAPGGLALRASACLSAERLVALLIRRGASLHLGQRLLRASEGAEGCGSASDSDVCKASDQR